VNWRRARSGGDGDAAGGDPSGGAGSPREREVDALLARARAAGGRGDVDAQARWSGAALEICRTLVAEDPAARRHRAALAAGAYGHAYRLLQVRRFEDARTVLAESRRHYAVLAREDPEGYEVALCDVTLREALVSVLEGDVDGALRVGREALAAYPVARAGDGWERDFGPVRARALLGRALLMSGRRAQAVEEFDAALFAAEALRERTGLSGTDFAWLTSAPPSFRLAAPEWLGAAVGAMELHDAEGRWRVAADAADIALRVSGGLAGIGDDVALARFQAIHARAQQIWQAARNPTAAAAARSGPTDEFLVSAEGVVLGLRTAPDLARIWRLAGWGVPPSR
jgi:hypothetical protein